MKDGMTLWNERVKAYWQETLRYLRLIGNSGFLFTIYILVIIGSYYYSVLLKWLPDNFPAMIVFVAVFAHFLTRGYVRTFVKRADMVFLLPYEAKLNLYFRASKWYSYAFQGAVLIVVMIVLTPLFTKYAAEKAGHVLFVLLFLLLVKGWNVLVSWEEERLQSNAERRMHFLFRGVFNAVFVFLLFSGAGMMYLCILAILMALLYYFYYRKLERTHSIKWEHLIEVEERSLLQFYRIANMFTDVPQLQHQVRERGYMNWLLPLLAKEKTSVYHYLFARSFIRANDYAGIYIRLALVAAIVLAFLPNGWLELVVFLLFMHMVTNQLATIWYHYDTSEMIDLYPVDATMKKLALTELSFRLLLIMTVVEVIVLLATSSLMIAACALVLGVLYSYMGSHTFIHKRKK